jgi:prevent-host-death family protein
MSSWSLQDAKNKFSEVVNRAQAEGPQVVTRRGRRAVVVMSAEEYDRLVPKKLSLGEFLLLPGEPWDEEFAKEVERRDPGDFRYVEF